jgi:photosystem II stability/assembly factor-like uncharacterized protein
MTRNNYFYSILICSIQFISINIFCQWTSLPIRSQTEFNAGAVGGEGEQYLQGFSRCLTNPDYIYAGQDVCGSWRSIDGGTTWKKNLDKGLYLQYSQSIEVDPINPNLVFIAVNQGAVWPGKANNYQGIYKSTDGGNSWALVLNSNPNSVRKMRHLIAYSLPSKPNATSSPTRWYAADVNGLWRSDMSGENGSWTKIAYLPATVGIIDVITHPTSIDTVYVASETGLYRSTNGGANLAKVTQFGSKVVTSVLMNAALPNKVYVTVSGEGMYLSVDNGATFTKTPTMTGLKDISTSIYRAVMNPGFPEQIYLIGLESSKTTWISNDSGLTYILLPAATTFPGFGRETGWRRWLDGNFAGICPNPLDKTNAIGTSRSTFHKVTNSGATVSESATGFTGNAAMQTDRSIAFHPFDPNVFGIFCFDVGPRITSTAGNWFYNADPALSTWRTYNMIKWAGSYSAAYQPIQGSKIVVASIGMYISTNQLMRSTDNGLTWGSAPITPNITDRLQAFHFIAFDQEIPTIVYAGDQISTDAGLTFNTIAFPASYTVNGEIPITCGVSQDPVTKKSYVFAIDGNRKIILRSDDHGASWFKFFDLSTVSGSARFLDSTPTFAAHPSDPNVVFALDANRDLLKITYNPLTSTVTTKGLNSFAALPSWMPADVKTFNQIRRIGIDPVDPNVMYVSMLVSGIPSVYRTLDGGTNWTSISDDLNYQGGCLVVNPHTRELYKGSMSGTYKYPAPPVSSLSSTNFPKINLVYSTENQLLNVIGALDNESFRICDTMGKSILQFRGTTVSISELPKGVFVLTNSSGVSQKFIKY